MQSKTGLLSSGSSFACSTGGVTIETIRACVQRQALTDWSLKPFGPFALHLCPYWVRDSGGFCYIWLDSDLTIYATLDSFMLSWLTLACFLIHFRCISDTFPAGHITRLAKTQPTSRCFMLWMWLIAPLSAAHLPSSDRSKSCLSNGCTCLTGGLNTLADLIFPGGEGEYLLTLPFAYQHPDIFCVIVARSRF